MTLIFNLIFGEAHISVSLSTLQPPQTKKRHWIMNEEKMINYLHLRQVIQLVTSDVIKIIFGLAGERIGLILVDTELFANWYGRITAVFD